MTDPRSERVRIGVISDTHGYLAPQVAGIFAGVRHIIHAGDIMDPQTLAELEAIAPVTAVAGNMDVGKLAKLPREIAGEIEGVGFVVGHKRKRLLKRLAMRKIDGLPDGAPDLVICGHDHLPAVEWVEGSLYLNPGSASSPHEEDDDPSVVVVEVEEYGLSARFYTIERSYEAFSG